MLTPGTAAGLAHCCPNSERVSEDCGARMVGRASQRDDGVRESCGQLMELYCGGE
jgi:hypothetical protein